MRRLHLVDSNTTKDGILYSAREEASLFRQIGDLRLDRMLIQPLVNSDFAAEAAIERQRAAAADQDREADQQ